MEDDGIFSTHVYSESFQEEFRKQWDSRCNFKGDNLEIISKPFRVCRISNFLRDETFIENLKCELEEKSHGRGFSDLYKNEKSDELRNASGDHIQLLYISLERYIAQWMEQNTGIRIEGDISLKSVRYYDTDYLLCHDDHTELRRIAFIFYLTKDWTEDDGGTLDFFDSDEYGAPVHVIKSLVPEYNSFVFFEVVGNSYHQIAEVKSSDKCRWALSGWFLGTKDGYCRLRRYNKMENYVQPNLTKVILSDWISRTYLLLNVRKEIQKDVEDNSYVAICGFLTDSMHEQISKDFTSQDIKWKMVGPADMRRYEVADEETLPELLKEFCNMFKSLSFRQLLMDYTHLNLLPEKEETKPKMTMEIQRWSAGCYTLLYNRSLMDDPTNIEKDPVQLDDDPSTVASTSNTSNILNGDTAPNANETHNELKRKSVDSPSLLQTSPNNKEKKAKHVDTSSDVNAQSSNTNESSANSNEDEDESSHSGTPTSEDSNSEKSGDYLLDLIMQFNTFDDEDKPKTEETIDYIDSLNDKTLIQVTSEKNQISLVYRSVSICRLQQYLNHYYKGYSYTIVCEYQE